MLCLRFSLKHEERLFYLRAKDDSECNRWVEVLTFLRYIQTKFDMTNEKRPSSTKNFFGNGALRSLKSEIRESRKRSHLFTNQSIDIINRIQSEGKS